jgi:hypothetical protein
MVGCGTAGAVWRGRLRYVLVWQVRRGVFCFGLACSGEAGLAGLVRLRQGRLGMAGQVWQVELWSGKVGCC